jgi:aldehyde:ferredoxin oxidoreductase
MERDFNNRAGFSREDDTLPKRLLTEPAKTGPAKGLTNGLDKMLPEYYQLRGWDEKGHLKPETRARLGL